MKISLDWLSEYVEVNQSPDELAELLTLSGAEVESITQIGDDTCIELEINSNRPDLLGTIGIARELAAATGRQLKSPPADFREEDKPIDDSAAVEVHDDELCPRYTARLIRGVSVKSSPAWMQKRLETIGLRPINNIVDITNYVLMECGQPLHAFDFDELNGGKVIVRRAREGEVITAIDGTKCALDPERLVIADADRPVAVAGVMGGADSEVTGATSDVLLESAVFDPVSIRRSSRTLNLASDSSYRFERTVDPVGCEWASRRAIHLISELAGGTVAGGLIDVNSIDLSEPEVTLRLSRIPRILGVEIDTDDAARILESLEFKIVDKSDDILTVGIPPFRREVHREVDLIEEVARIWGYDRIPDTSGMRITAGGVSKTEAVARELHDALVRVGYDEVITTSFVAPDSAEELTPWDSSPLTITNPLRADEGSLRASVLPGLLQVKQHNYNHGTAVTHLYEISRVQRRNTDGAPAEIDAVGLLGDDGFREMKGIVQTILDRLGLASHCVFAPRNNKLFEPGKVLAVLSGERLVGWLGKLAGAAKKYCDVPDLPYFAEIDISALMEDIDLNRQVEEPPRFPVVRRDLAVVVSETTTWQDVTQCIESIEEPLREAVEFVDLYRGKQIGDGLKSLMFSVVYRHPERTLTSEEVTQAQERLTAALEKQIDAKLRT